jgi:hypothetical protein
LKSCFQELKLKGFGQAYLWVIENNPTISFYERSGAEKLEHILEDVIGTQTVRELCYCWNELN